MAVFEVLSEVVCAVELLALVTLSKLVDSSEMVTTCVPIRCRDVGKLLTAVSTNIKLGRHPRWLWWSVIGIGIGRNGIARMESGLVVTVKSGARPRMAPEVK